MGGDHHHGHEVRVAVATPEDWRVVRHLRLGALADEPDAFGATLDEEAPQPESFWRDRLAGDHTTLLASWVGDDGEARPAGLCAIGPYWRGTDDDAALTSVWVAPSGRGKGIGDALVEAAIEHARGAGYARLLLEVGDHNEPAQRLYGRHGFVRTGRTGSLPPPRTDVSEHELGRDLT